MNRFKLEPSKDLPNWWVLTDIENLIVCKFEQGKFNDTQTFSIIEEEEFVKSHDASGIARIMTEMGDYVARYHGGKAFDEVYGYEYEEGTEQLYLCRYKQPKWRIEITDYIGKKPFAESLKKAAEWINKRPER